MTEDLRATSEKRIENIPGYEPGFKLFLTPAMYRAVESDGWDMRDFVELLPLSVS